MRPSLLLSPKNSLVQELMSPRFKIYQTEYYGQTELRFIDVLGSHNILTCDFRHYFFFINLGNLVQSNLVKKRIITSSVILSLTCIFLNNVHLAYICGPLLGRHLPSWPQHLFRALATHLAPNSSHNTFSAWTCLTVGACYTTPIVWLRNCVENFSAHK